jgi:hypothetical protein
MSMAESQGTAEVGTTDDPCPLYSGMVNISEHKSYEPVCTW